MKTIIKCEALDTQNNVAATLVQHAENDYLVLFIDNNSKPAEEILSVKLYPDGHWEKI